VPVETWILAFGGVFIDLGLMCSGWRIMRSLGNNLTCVPALRHASSAALRHRRRANVHFSRTHGGRTATTKRYHSPSRGFAMELGALTTVLYASQQGKPVSTTHCITGATVGVGLCGGDLRCVNWIMVYPPRGRWCLHTSGMPDTGQRHCRRFGTGVGEGEGREGENPTRASEACVPYVGCG